MPELSVIMVNYNTFTTTCRAIESVFTYCTTLDFELILVDNGSEETAPAPFKERFPSLILVESKRNLGFAGGNNLGIQAAKGKYLLLLNPDVILQSDALSLALNRLKSSSRPTILGIKLTYEDGSIQHTAQPLPSLFLEILVCLRFQKLMSASARARYLQGPYVEQEQELEAGWLWGAFLMFERTALQAFDQQRLPEDFFLYGEDMQWCWQWKRKGYTRLYSPVATAIHLQAQSPAPERMQLMLENEYQLVLSMKGWWYAKALFFIRMVTFLSVKSPSLREQALRIRRTIFQSK